MFFSSLAFRLAARGNSTYQMQAASEACRSSESGLHSQDVLRQSLCFLLPSRVIIVFFTTLAKQAKCLQDRRPNQTIANSNGGASANATQDRKPSHGRRNATQRG